MIVVNEAEDATSAVLAALDGDARALVLSREWRVALAARPAQAIEVVRDAGYTRPKPACL